MSAETPAPPTPDPTEPLPDELAEEIDAQDHEFSLEDLAAAFNDPAEPDAEPDEGEDEGDPADPDAAEGQDPAAEGEPQVEEPPADPATSELETPADPEPAPAPAPASEPAPVDDLIQFQGATYRKADVEAVISWVESLTPEQVAALNNPAAATPPGAPAPTAAPEPAADGLPEDVVDPQLADWTARQIAAVNERLESIQRSEEQRARQEAQLAEAAFAQAFDEARAATRDQFGLTETETDLLLQTAAQTNAVGFISNQNPNLENKELLEAAFEATFWNTPAFRDKAVTAKVAEATGNIQVDAQIAERKNNNSSIVGSGAVTPRQQRPKPQTTEDHHQAAVDLVAEALKTGNQ